MDRLGEGNRVLHINNVLIYRFIIYCVTVFFCSGRIIFSPIIKSYKNSYFPYCTILCVWPSMCSCQEFGSSFKIRYYRFPIEPGNHIYPQPQWGRVAPRIKCWAVHFEICYLWQLSYSTNSRFTIKIFLYIFTIPMAGFELQNFTLIVSFLKRFIRLPSYKDEFLSRHHYDFPWQKCNLFEAYKQEIQILIRLYVSPVVYYYAKCLTF